MSELGELIFNVTQEPDGGFVAVAVGESIATQGDTWDELCFMVVDATRLYFSNRTSTPRVRLLQHREQVLAA